MGKNRTVESVAPVLLERIQRAICLLRVPSQTPTRRPSRRKTRTPADVREDVPR